MSKRGKLFKHRKPYDLEKTNDLFLKAIKKNCKYQYKHCLDYKRILDEKKFNPEDLKTYEDIEKIPFIPTLYFKHHELFSMSKKRMIIKATSSGTSGKKSIIGFNIKSLLSGLSMVIRIGRYHHLWSLKPTRYVIFGYEPNKKNQMAIAKTAYGFTFFAPAIKRNYALRFIDGKYQLDLENIKKN